MAEGDFPPVTLVGDSQREQAKRYIDQAPEGYVVRVTEATRTILQNKKLWPMLEDLKNQATVADVKLTKDEWKDYCTAELLIEEGYDIKILPRRDGRGFIIVGMGTRNLSKKRFSNLLEIMHQIGAEQEVVWSEKAQKVIDEYGQEWEVK